MVCPPWHVSLAWRSPRSIPTGQDGRRPLQHKLGVTYIYVLKCITHRRPSPLRTELPFSFRRLQPSSVSPATRLHGHRTSSLLSRRPGVPTFLTAESEFCKSRTALAPLTIILKRKFERILVNSAYTAVNYSPTFEARVYFRLCYGPC